MPQLKNRRWEIFACELAAGTPLLDAYLVAGYKPGYSARFNASRLRNTKPVRGRVDELLVEFGERCRIKVEYLQERILLPIAQAKAPDLFEYAGDQEMKLRDLRKLPPELAAAISKLKFDKDTGKLVEISLHDKVQATGLLMRSIGVLQDSEFADRIAALEKETQQ